MADMAEGPDHKRPELSGADYPRRYDVPGLQERRMVWTARLIASCFMASALLNVVLAMAIWTMLPLKEVRPFLVQIAGRDDVVAAIEPYRASLNGMEILVEDLVREYVVKRETILRGTAENDTLLATIWGVDGFIARTTSAEEYSRFANEKIPVLEELRRAGASQEIRLDAVVPLRADPGFPAQGTAQYQVEFTAVGRGPNEQEVSRNEFVATLLVGFRRQTGLTRSQALVNPLGFTVVTYSLRQKER